MSILINSLIDPESDDETYNNLEKLAKIERKESQKAIKGLKMKK